VNVESTRESQLVEAFVTLADTLAAGYDIVDLLHTLVERCATLLDAQDSGIILATPEGELEVIASTSERSRLVGLMQLRAGEGPCVESYLTRSVVSVDNVDGIDARWPRFAVGARELGFKSIHAIPLRLRDTTIGSLNLFRDREGGLDEGDKVAAQALADVATISILHERAFRETDVARRQLQHALGSRVIIEQAKGVISHTRGVDMDEAFRLIRTHARSTGERLSEVARSVVDRSIDL
jgi:GAF domain-containing protein